MMHQSIRVAVSPRHPAYARKLEDPRPPATDANPPCMRCSPATALRRPIRVSGRHGEAVTDHLPTRIGPYELGQLGNWITVRCPRELAPLMRQASGQWEPGRRGRREGCRQ